MVSTYEIYSKLNENKNYRFYLNTLNNFEVYTSQINIQHSYASKGNYPINIVFLNSSSITIQQLVNITDCKQLFY